jgi:hypothetical protein
METSSWLGYTAAMEKDLTPICSEPPGHKYPATESKTTWWTGFQDLTPANPELQAKYDAMSDKWAGINPTNKAVVNGLFSSQPSPLDKTLPQYKK